MIWLGNLLFMKVVSLGGPAFGMNLLFGALIKAGVLFLGAKIFFSLSLVPEFFLTAMGINQVLTALMGGVLAKIGLLIIDYKKDDRS